MAYIEGDPKDKSGKSVFGQMGFTLITGFALIAIMLFFSDDLKSDLTAIFTIAAVIAAVMILVLYKLNPMGWKKIFNRAEFEKELAQNIKVIEKFSELDDSYFIINDFSFELFHVEHLVVSENGVFVISKIRDTGELKIIDGVLHAGETSLETLTSRVWRVSHLVNIIVKKGFGGAEIMPKPVLVLPDVSRSSIKEFNGIRIIGIDEIKREISVNLKFKVDKPLAEGVAFFIKQRYIKNDQ
jgi:hypothetical protein